MTRPKRKFFDPTYVPHERRRSTILAFILVWSVTMFCVVHFFLLGTMVVQGNSMTPTLWPGDRLLVHRWVFMLRPPHRGEIVVINDPEEHGTFTVKRVVALPGETVRIHDKRVYINDVVLEEKYLADNVRTNPFNIGDKAYRVEPGSYFVLGDNRPASVDSRSFGAISRRNVLGKIMR